MVSVRMLTAALLTVVVSACRNDEVEPRYNVNLGTQDAPLLPCSGPIMDSGILSGGRAGAVDLPELADLPTLAEIEAQQTSRESDSRDVATDREQAGASDADEDEAEARTDAEEDEEADRE